MTRDQKTGRIEDIKFFKAFYDADLEEQQSYLRHLLEVSESKPKTDAEIGSLVGLVPQ